MVPLFQDNITIPGLSPPNLCPSFSHVILVDEGPRVVHVKCAISPLTVLRAVGVLAVIEGPEKRSAKRNATKPLYRGNIFFKGRPRMVLTVG